MASRWGSPVLAKSIHSVVWSPILNPDLLHAIRKSYSSLFFINLMSGFIFAAIGVICLLSQLFITATNGLQGFLRLVGMILILIGVINTYYYQSRHVDIARLLVEDPQQVVWIYRQINTGKVSGVQVAQFQFIVFGLRNKRRIPVRLPASAINLLLEDIPMHLPHVTLGYSQETEKTFRESPDALLRRPG